jgi:hypothetical protein
MKARYEEPTPFSKNRRAKKLAEIAGFFNQKLGEEKVVFYLAEFARVDDKVFEAACDEACRAERSFPTPRTLREYVALAERAKYASETPKSLREIFTDRTRDPELVKESRALLRSIYQHHLHAADLVAAMQQLEKVFPGYGWGPAASSLADDLAKMRGRK